MSKNSKIIQSLRMRGDDRFVEYILNNREAIQDAGKDVHDFAVARWLSLKGDAEPFPYPLPVVEKPPEPPPEPPKAKNPIPVPPPDEPIKPAQQGIPDVMLTDAERRVAALVESSKEFPDIKVGDVLKKRVEMAIPRGVALPEYSYKWAAVDNLEADLTSYGGIFMIVNRTNHPHVDKRLFGNTGGIVYKRENILCFTRKAFSHAINKQIEDEFSMKADDAIDNLDKSFNVSGKEMARITMEEDPGEMPGAEVLTEESEYDFEAPQ